MFSHFIICQIHITLTFCETENTHNVFFSCWVKLNTLCRNVFEFVLLAEKKNSRWFLLLHTVGNCWQAVLIQWCDTAVIHHCWGPTVCNTTQQSCDDKLGHVFIRFPLCVLWMGFVSMLCSNWLNYSVCVFVCFVTVQATWDRGAPRRPHCYGGDVNTTGMGLTVEAALCGEQHVRCLCVCCCWSSWIINTLISKYFYVSISMRRLIIHTVTLMEKLHSCESGSICTDLYERHDQCWSFLFFDWLLSVCVWRLFQIDRVVKSWFLAVCVFSLCRFLSPVQGLDGWVEFSSRWSLELNLSYRNCNLNHFFPAACVVFIL